MTQNSIRYKNHNFPIAKPLNQIDMMHLSGSLSLGQVLKLLFTHKVAFPKAQPPKGCTYKVWLLYRNKQFAFSYPQGFEEELYVEWDNHAVKA